MDALVEDAASWLRSFGEPDAALSMLLREDWDVFNRYPMMRGSGARLSTRRLFFLAMLAHRLERIGETDAYLQLGDKAVDDHTPERLMSRRRKWFEAIEVRLKPGSKTEVFQTPAPPAH